MKAIITHDVDHITVKEHWKDLFLPKFIIRNSIEFCIRSISIKEYIHRWVDIFNNKWQNIEEIIKFNKTHRVPATFFIAVNNDLGLSYSLKQAEKWINIIKNEGFDVGVHGIKFNNFEEMKNEYNLFHQISGLSNFGIRQHYLRSVQSTLLNMEKIGYIFDSTIYSCQNPYKFGNLYEFPIQIMDSYEILGHAKWQNSNLDKIKENTLKRINEVRQKKISYIVILFHDFYFSESFISWKEWYISIIQFLIENGIELTDFRKAICEINQTNLS
ncbi:MAG: hypothetical protein HY738_14520 [Bacteroidia bacterium]|nr:hypothetical protein [Bacteroidia bacterium]